MVSETNTQSLQEAISVIEKAAERSRDILTELYQHVNELKVPYGYMPRSAKVYDDTEYSGEVDVYDKHITWTINDHDGDWDSVSVPLDVFDGTRTVRQWAEDIYQQHIEAIERENAAAEARKKAREEQAQDREYQEYLRLRAKFEGDSKFRLARIIEE